jgi:L-asparaginase II
MRLQIDVIIWRGAIPESRHRIQAAVCDRDGRPVAGTSGADVVTTFRSSAKPFQLLPLVERGHAERWRFEDEDLAVMVASHTGSAYHLERVAAILRRLGLTDRHLACGYHEPTDPDALARVRAHPEERSPLYNNCSGKHAGLLCLALSEGWPVEGYERADHPVQQLMRSTVAEMAGLAPEQLAVAVDGCSVSVFGLPLTGMARAYGRLAAAAVDGDARDRALARIRSAMSAFPRAVEGEGRFSTLLMQHTRGKLVAKGGAEGLQCVAWPERGQGFALKCEDGQPRAIAPAALAVLEHLSALAPDELERLSNVRRPVIHNPAGTEVGAVEATVRVLDPAVA